MPVSARLDFAQQRKPQRQRGAEPGEHISDLGIERGPAARLDGGENSRHALPRRLRPRDYPALRIRHGEQAVEGRAHHRETILHPAHHRHAGVNPVVLGEIIGGHRDHPDALWPARRQRCGGARIGADGAGEIQVLADRHRAAAPQQAGRGAGPELVLERRQQMALVIAGDGAVRLERQRHIAPGLHHHGTDHDGGPHLARHLRQRLRYRIAPARVQQQGAFRNDDQPRALRGLCARRIGIGPRHRRAGIAIRLARRRAPGRLVRQRRHPDGAQLRRLQLCHAERQGQRAHHQAHRTGFPGAAHQQRQGIGEQAQQEGHAIEAGQRRDLDGGGKRHLGIGDAAKGAMRRHQAVKEFDGGPDRRKGKQRRGGRQTPLDGAGAAHREAEQRAEAQHHQHDGGPWQRACIGLHHVTLPRREAEKRRREQRPARTIAIGQPQDRHRRNPGHPPHIEQALTEKKQHTADKRA